MTSTSTPEADKPMPVWVDDCHMDWEWIRRKTKLPTISGNDTAGCLVQDMSNQGRLGATPRGGATLKLTLALEQQEGQGVDGKDDAVPLTLIIKQVPSSGRPLSQQLGLAREALFYNQLAPDIQQGSDNNNKLLPTIHYAWGDMTTGSKVVVMEDLSQQSVDSGIFFGPGNPNNWNRDLPAMVARVGSQPPSAGHVASVTFQAMARIHATFWCRNDLLNDKNEWLRGHSWLLGKGKESWEASMGLVRQCWNTNLEREQRGGEPGTLKWDPLVRATIEAAIQGISWQAQTDRLHTKGQWTLVHGDFWPGNIMWMINNSNNTSSGDEIRFLDWEMVGLGSGPQDLGQYILSNMDPAERRACEHDLVQAYFQELKRCDADNKIDLSWEQCWREYKIGGLERWLWFLVYFVGQEGPLLDWAQFFHNQIASFMHDHEISPSDISQPRP